MTGLSDYGKDYELYRLVAAAFIVLRRKVVFFLRLTLGDI